MAVARDASNGRAPRRRFSGFGRRLLSPVARETHGVVGVPQGKLKKARRLDINMYTDGHTVSDAKKLPLNLLHALRELQRSPVLGEALGDLVPAFVKLKTEEWNSYARSLTQWERDHTLDC